ncbi:hypothetical protein [Proteiniclasticum ruminis]|uniref:hypothetical protein n=1 Tax=Proteiniclasticum ruminis TaxID=398199 RepID=UPI00138E0B00|nr:hypothetical protein [Proteiniclasticum ruminis]
MEVLIKEKAVANTIENHGFSLLNLNFGEKEAISMKYSTSDEGDSKKIEIYSEK